MGNLNILYKEHNYVVTSCTVALGKITPEDISEIKPENTDRVLVLTNETIDTVLRKALESKNIQVDKVIVSKNNNNTKGELRLPEGYIASSPNYSEYVILLEKTFSTEQANRLHFFDHAEIRSLIQTLSGNFENRKVVKISKLDKLLGLCVLSRMSILQSNSNLVSWVWIADNVDLAERKLVHNAINIWINNESTLPKTFASINIENLRSLKFFSKLGFTVEGITF